MHLQFYTVLPGRWARGQQDTRPGGQKARKARTMCHYDLVPFWQCALVALCHPGHVPFWPPCPLAAHASAKRHALCSHIIALHVRLHCNVWQQGHERAEMILKFWVLAKLILERIGSGKKKTVGPRGGGGGGYL